MQSVVVCYGSPGKLLQWAMAPLILRGSEEGGCKDREEAGITVWQVMVEGHSELWLLQVCG